MNDNMILKGNCTGLIKDIDSNSAHLIIRGIPYGISFKEGDILHSSSNKTLLGNSLTQKRCGNIFIKRGKPLNGLW